MYVVMFITGLGVGGLLRGFGRLKLASRLWPVVHHVMDWQKVDQLLAVDSEADDTGV